LVAIVVTDFGAMTVAAVYATTSQSQDDNAGSAR